MTKEEAKAFVDSLTDEEVIFVKQFLDKLIYINKFTCINIDEFIGELFDEEEKEVNIVR